MESDITLDTLPIDLIYKCIDYDVAYQAKQSPLRTAPFHQLLVPLRFVSKKFKHLIDTAPGLKRDWRCEAWRLAAYIADSITEDWTLFKWMVDSGANYTPSSLRRVRKGSDLNLSWKAVRNPDVLFYFATERYSTKAAVGLAKGLIAYPESTARRCAAHLVKPQICGMLDPKSVRWNKQAVAGMLECNNCEQMITLRSLPISEFDDYHYWPSTVRSLPSTDTPSSHLVMRSLKLLTSEDMGLVIDKFPSITYGVVSNIMEPDSNVGFKTANEFIQKCIEKGVDWWGFRLANYSVATFAQTLTYSNYLAAAKLYPFDPDFIRRMSVDDAMRVAQLSQDIEIIRLCLSEDVCRKLRFVKTKPTIGCHDLEEFALKQQLLEDVGLHCYFHFTNCKESWMHLSPVEFCERFQGVIIPDAAFVYDCLFHGRLDVAVQFFSLNGLPTHVLQWPKIVSWVQRLGRYGGRELIKRILDYEPNCSRESVLVDLVKRILGELSRTC
jgi:hypothetical protein